MSTKRAVLAGTAGVVVAIAMSVAPASGVQLDDDAHAGILPVEGSSEGLPGAHAVAEVPGPDLRGLAGEPGPVVGCLEEDGSVSTLSDAELESGAGADCPEWVNMSDFKEVDWGPDAIGVRMCRLTEQFPRREGTHWLGAIGAKIWAIFTGRGEVKTWEEDTRTMCSYYGCELTVTLGEAVWSTRN